MKRLRNVQFRGTIPFAMRSLGTSDLGPALTVIA
jgi:hypothetical protein